MPPPPVPPSVGEGSRSRNLAHRPGVASREPTLAAVRDLVDGLAASVSGELALQLHAAAVAAVRNARGGASCSGFQHHDGSLKIATWAEGVELTEAAQTLAVEMHELPSRMVGANATGKALVSNEYLGVDVIRLVAGEAFAPHTHVGDHLLIAVGGIGTVACGGRIYPTHAGQVYMIEGLVPHAVGAITDHVLLAVGAPHRAVDALDRQQLVEPASLFDAVGELRCLICNLVIHRGEAGCPHDPTSLPRPAEREAH